jgi:intracellular multiplication protein IcmL
MMANEETNVVELLDDFYRDSFAKVLLIVFSLLLAGGILVLLSIYLHGNKPRPVVFPVEDEMRVQAPVPLSQAYLSNADLSQWVADVLPRAFKFDFYRYNDQLKDHERYFTPEGWTAFSNQLNIYANYTNVQTNKLFITATPGTAPYIENQGIVPESGVYGWKVKVPITINYTGLKPPQNVNLVLQLLVVRVSTLNNLTGVAIDDVIQAPVSTG